MLYKLVNFYKRQNHIEYARSRGVKGGDNCRFVGSLSWGSELYLTSKCNHVLISGNVSFINHDGSTCVFHEEGSYKFGPIIVGNNCFIGVGVTIIMSVNIGDDCIIGTGSLVTKDIASGEV